MHRKTESFELIVRVCGMQLHFSPILLTLGAKLCLIGIPCRCVVVMMHKTQQTTIWYHFKLTMVLFIAAKKEMPLCVSCSMYSLHSAGRTVVIKVRV